MESGEDGRSRGDPEDDRRGRGAPGTRVLLPLRDGPTGMRPREGSVERFGHVFRLVESEPAGWKRDEPEPGSLLTCCCCCCWCGASAASGTAASAAASSRQGGETSAASGSAASAAAAAARPLARSAETALRRRGEAGRTVLGFLDELAADGDDGGRRVQELLAGGVAVAAGLNRRRG